MEGFNAREYLKDYKKKYYDRIVFYVPKGKKEFLKEVADNNGKSVSRLIIESIEKQYHIDLTIDESRL